MRGPTELVQYFRLYIGRVNIGARALFDINLIWFGYIARYPGGEEGVFYLFKLVLPAFAALRGRGAGMFQHPVLNPRGPLHRTFIYYGLEKFIIPQV
jgi:hypothetical protein